MSETKLILGLARREAAERARSKAFRISTVILVLAAGAAVFLPNVLGLDDEVVHRVGVVEGAPAGLEQAITASTPEAMAIETVTVADRAAGEAALTAEEDSLDVVVTDEPGLLWADTPDLQLESIVRSAVTQLTIVDRATELGIDPAEVGPLLAPVELPSTTVAAPGGAQGVEDAEERGPQAIIATVGMVLLFVSITFYGSYILMSVIEEKQNRVVECSSPTSSRVTCWPARSWATAPSGSHRSSRSPWWRRSACR